MPSLAASTLVVGMVLCCGLLVGGCVGAFLAFAFFYLQNDIHRNYLDPKVPFQIYKPPLAPDYEAILQQALEEQAARKQDLQQDLRKTA